MTDDGPALWSRMTLLGNSVLVVEKYPKEIMFPNEGYPAVDWSDFAAELEDLHVATLFASFLWVQTANEQNFAPSASYDDIAMKYAPRFKDTRDIKQAVDLTVEWFRAWQKKDEEARRLLYEQNQQLSYGENYPYAVATNNEINAVTEAVQRDPNFGYEVEIREPVRQWTLGKPMTHRNFEPMRPGNMPGSLVITEPVFVKTVYAPASKNVAYHVYKARACNIG